MKIAIPLDENKIDVCPVLARAPYFLVVENNTTTIISNPATEAPSGAGGLMAGFIVDNNVTVLITPRCGQNANEVFTVAGIKIYKSNFKTANENITAFNNNELQPLTNFHGGFHGIQ